MAGKQVHSVVGSFDERAIIVDGVKYVEDRITMKKIGKTRHVDKSIFVKVDEKKQKEMMDDIKREILKNTIDKEALVIG